MAVFRPRTRLVNFRLSEDEYQQLKDSCARSGARSVSDYARAAVLSGTGFPAIELHRDSSLIRSEAGGQPRSSAQSFCADRWERLEGTVQDIQQNIHSLAQHLAIQISLPAQNPIAVQEHSASHG